MNAIVNFGTSSAQPSMTSLEIAALVDSRHDKVKQSIERPAERGAISLPPMGEVNVEREHHDFAVFAETGNNPLGGRPAKEYAISLDMAKELAMVGPA